MKIGLVGGSYEQISLPFDAQRSVNLFPVIDEQGKEIASMYGTPGLKEFTTIGTGPIRGGFKSSNGRVFFISGSEIYEVDSAGISTLRGSLLTSSGNLTLAESNSYFAICDGDKLYYLQYSTNDFGITASSIPSSVGTVTNIDGYFIINENNSGRFYISQINNPTVFDALDFATAESSPDLLLSVINAVGQLWLLGSQSGEIWTNTGSSSFPFSRISGAVMEVGIQSPYSALEIDNTIMWVGQDSFGGSIVYRANGFTPLRISTTPIEIRLKKATQPENIYSWAYQEDGHLFYILSGGGLETSLVYDLTTQTWHERAFLNDDGDYEQHLGSCHVFAFSKNLVGDRRNGKIYEMSLDIYSDDGQEISRERTYTHLIDEARRIRYNSLEIGFETGVGLQSGQGSNPLVSLQLSKDGARTWSSPKIATIGKVGQYRTKVKFRRLGIAEQMTFRLTITEKVKIAITGSYLF